MTTRKNPSITVAFPTVTLRKLCDQAEALGLAEGPNAKFWEDVDEDGTHVASFDFPGTGVVDHGGGQQSARAMVACKMRGRTEPQGLLCDFDYLVFTMLVRNGLHVRNGRKKSAG